MVGTSSFCRTLSARPPWRWPKVKRGKGNKESALSWHSNLSVVSEGIVPAATIERTPDDEVVEESDFHFAGRFGETTGEVGIGVAWRGVAGRVIVGEDEIDGLIDEDGAEDFADGGKSLIGGATGDFPHANETGGGIESQDDQFFGGEVGELGREEFINRLAVQELDVLAAIAGGTGSEFEGGLDLTGFRQTKPVFATEFLEIQLGEGNQPPVFPEKLPANFDGTGSLCSGSEKDGQKLLVGEGGSPQRFHFFPRLLIAREIVDADAFFHLN